MKRLFLGLALSLAFLATAHADSAWLTDFNAAKEQAKKDNKAILLDFTGSDWCGFCIRLKKAVFQKPEFAKFAEENLVLLEVDFPRRAKMSMEQKRANRELGEKFEVQGYPTIVITDAAGKELGRMEGYEGENVDEYIKKLRKFLAKAK